MKAPTRTDKPVLDKDQRKFLESELKGASEFDLQRFFITCERTGLDPFTRQIYGHLQNVNKGSKDKPDWKKQIVIVTSIDGFRAIAERTGQYRGQTAPEWYYGNDEGKLGWHDVFIPKRDQKGHPISLPEACRVGIIREGFPQPVYGVANFDSFAKYKKDGNEWALDLFWGKMPEHMIAKVAEAHGHRKTFPLLCSDLYIYEEITNGDDETSTSGRPPRSQTLPEGATWVEGHSPEERTAAAKETAFATKTDPATEPTKEEKKPATGQQEPAATPAKKGGKKEKAASPAKTIATQDELPLPGAEPDPPQHQEPAANWKDHVITQITMPSITGKKLGDLPPNEIKRLKVGWVDKYKDRFANNPKKVEEATMIELAFAAQTAK